MKAQIVIYLEFPGMSSYGERLPHLPFLVLCLPREFGPVHFIFSGNVTSQLPKVLYVCYAPNISPAKPYTHSYSRVYSTVTSMGSSVSQRPPKLGGLSRQLMPKAFPHGKSNCLGEMRQFGSFTKSCPCQGKQTRQELVIPQSFSFFSKVLFNSLNPWWL